MIRRYELGDAQWQRVAHLLPGKEDQALASRQTYGGLAPGRGASRQAPRVAAHALETLAPEEETPVMADRSQRQSMAKNCLARVPTPDRPDQVWVAGITFIDTGKDWLYLAGLPDARQRRGLGCDGFPCSSSLCVHSTRQATDTGAGIHQISQKE